MVNTAQKLHHGYTSNKAVQTQALALIHNLGKALPVTIKKINDNQTAVTLSFDMNGKTYTLPDVVVPMHLSRYYRIPYAVGDKGYVVPGSVSVTPSSGLGPAVAAFTTLANLSTLVFHPIANVPKFAAMDDPDAVQHNAPKGTISRDDQKVSQVKTHPTNGATIQSGGDSAPQHFTASPDGNTTHAASKNHTATITETKASTAKIHTHTSTESHSISAPTIGLAASTAISMSAPSMTMPPATAAANIGPLGGELTGTLPNPTINGSAFHQYASNTLALAGGLVAGQLYANTAIAASEYVLCVVH